MAVNKFKPHVLVIPEDDKDRQIAKGFEQHDQLNDRQYAVMPPAGGWRAALQKIGSEYVSYLRSYPDGYLVLLIDFDGDYSRRRSEFDEAVPSDLKDRVFVVGARTTPESLQDALRMDCESIGLKLADDCFKSQSEYWLNKEIAHNEPDRKCLESSVKPFLFNG